MSLRAAGYKVQVQPMSVVIHYEHISAPTTGNRTNTKLQEQNKPKFLNKWGRVLARHPRPSEPWDIVKDVGVSRRCLFFDWRTPRVDEDAGSYAAMQEMRLLQSLGIKVTFASLEMEYAGRHTEALQRVGIECAYAPYYKNWQALLDERGSEFDFVYGMRFEVMEQVIDGIRTRMPRAKILFNPADLHFLRLSREARLKKSSGDPLADQAFAKAEGVKDRELSVMRRSDAIVVYNEIECEVVQTNLPGSLVTVLPFFVPTRADVPDWSKRSGVSFLGSHQHAPNRDAVDFFARQVMPLIRQQIPECGFYIYGSEMELMRGSLEDLQSAGVVVVGSVKDVSDAFDQHRVFVAPMRFGSGIKGKVVMALCNGIPTVLTSVAAEGTHTRDEQEVIQAETPAEFAAAVITLHQDAARWQSISDAALRFGRAEFSKDRARDALRATILGTGITVPN
jgi:glycosyltransferase involved in cell wall biosynthesis